MHIDETPLQILRSDKASGSDHYIVVRSGGPPGQRIILYDYRTYAECPIASKGIDERLRTKLRVMWAIQTVRPILV
jgi:hypothetical protein